MHGIVLEGKEGSRRQLGIGGNTLCHVLFFWRFRLARRLYPKAQGRLGVMLEALSFPGDVRSMLHCNKQELRMDRGGRG